MYKIVLKNSCYINSIYKRIQIDRQTDKQIDRYVDRSILDYLSIYIYNFSWEE